MCSARPILRNSKCETSKCCHHLTLRPAAETLFASLWLICMERVYCTPLRVIGRGDSRWKSGAIAFNVNLGQRVLEPAANLVIAQEFKNPILGRLRYFLILEVHVASFAIFWGGVRR